MFIEQEIKAKISNLKEQYERDGFDSLYIDTALFSFDENELTIKFYMEISQTCFINRLSYANEVKAFIEQNKALILNEFCPLEHRPINPKSINFQIKLVSEETHNQGKLPAFITFNSNENPLFKIVYKPRSAAIDRAVIDTFDQINQLPSEHRSSDIPLPTYKILDFPARSLWEYVEGEDIAKLSKADSVGIFIRQSLSGSRKERAEQRLNRMDAILTRMGISDLHTENVRAKNFKDKSKDVELIPIDLENRHKGILTQLGGRPKEVRLTPEEDRIIEEFFEPRAQDAPFRYLPLSTRVMAGLVGNYLLAETLAKTLLERFEADKFLVDIPFSRLQGLLLMSILSHDVPYFTKWRGILYYGLLSENNIIARKED
jgi:hypothetical protein